MIEGSISPIAFLNRGEMRIKFYNINNNFLKFVLNLPWKVSMDW